MFTHSCTSTVTPSTLMQYYTKPHTLHHLTSHHPTPHITLTLHHLTLHHHTPYTTSHLTLLSPYTTSPYTTSPHTTPHLTLLSPYTTSPYTTSPHTTPHLTLLSPYTTSHRTLHLVLCPAAEAAKVTASDQRTNRVAGSKLCVLNVSD